MSEHLITAIRVEKLFGLYTYRLPQDGAFSNASILYGDNGAGKSTILRIAFHLLSAAENRRHRTQLHKADFKKFEVDLVSGVTLSASRNDKLPNILSLTITKNGKILVIWDYQPERKSEFSSYFEGKEFSVVYGRDGSSRMVKKSGSMDKEDQSIPRGEDAYMEVLRKNVPTVFILNSDRRLDSDSVSDPSDEMELRKVMRYEEPKRINDLVVRSREIALSQAMSLAARWIGKKAIQGANQGSMNVHSVYVDVLRHVLTPQQNPDEQASDVNASLLPLLKPFGRLYLMEDEAQRLYDREAFDIPDAVTIICNDNHRSPRSVCQVINALSLASTPIISKSPYQGEQPEFRSYNSDAALIKQTELAVNALLEQGFAIKDIVILTGRGHSKSKLLNAERLGRFTTRRFTGSFTRDGNPVWSDGELTVESIYRFKGQSAPAIILSEVDFTELTDKERRKLFVGMTRAQLNLQVVLSDQAEACFASALG